MPEGPSGGSLEPSAPAAVCRVRSALWLSHVGLPCCSSPCQDPWQHSFLKVHKAQWWAPQPAVGRQEMQVGVICSCCGYSQDSEGNNVWLSLITWLSGGLCPQSWVRCQVWDTVQAESCHQCHFSALGGWDAPCLLGDLPPCAGLQDMPAQSLLCTSMLCLLRTCKVILPCHPPRDFKRVERAKTAIEESTPWLGLLDFPALALFPQFIAFCPFVTSLSVSH